jgi:hypothetical protein
MIVPSEQFEAGKPATKKGWLTPGVGATLRSEPRRLSHGYENGIEGFDGP